MRKNRFFNAVIMTAALMAAGLVMAACQLGTGSTLDIFTAFKGTSGNSYTNWTQVTDSVFISYFKGAKLYGAAFGNGVYVVVGDGGLAAYSKDCVTWVPSSTGSGVTYYHNQVNACVFLQDGPNGTGHFYTFGENSSGASYIVSSTDGDVWTAVSQTVFTVVGDYIWDIAYGDGVYVMVCDGFTSSNPDVYSNNKIARSTDLVNWTYIVSGTGTITGPAYQVEYANGIFVVVGGDSAGESVYSTNGGQTWSPATTFIGGTQSRGLVYGITGNNNDTASGIFFSVGRASTNQTKYTSDGISWAAYTVTWTQYINAVAYGDGLFLIGGNGQAKLAADPTADANWTTLSNLQLIFTSGVWINAAAWGDVNSGRFIAVGDNGTAAYSTN